MKGHPLITSLLRSLRAAANYYISYRKERRADVTGVGIYGIWLGDPPRLLRLDQITAGTILLGAGSPSSTPLFNTKSRAVVTLATGGHFSHAGIVLASASGQLRVFEAMPETGVKETSLSDFFGRYQYLSAYTLACWSDTSLRKASEYAASRIGAPYSHIKALLVSLRYEQHLRKHWALPGTPKYGRGRVDRERKCKRWPSAGKQATRGTICSTFVMEILRGAGIPGIDDDYFSPESWTPIAIAEARGVFTLVGYVVRNGYSDISQFDPNLGGNGHLLLGRWQAALEAGDEEVLRAYSSSIRREIEARAEEARKSSGMTSSLTFL